MLSDDGRKHLTTPATVGFVGRSRKELRDQLLLESRELVIEQAAIVGAAGSVRPLERGEDLETSEIADAEHWVATYTELVAFSRDLLAEMAPPGVDSSERRSESLSPSRLAGEIQLQLRLLHLRYWRRRRDQLRELSARRRSERARRDPSARR